MKAQPPARPGRAAGREVRTFLRVLGFARPYWPRLAVGALCSIVGGGSILAMFLTAQQLLSLLLDARFAEAPAPAAVAVARPDASAADAPTAPDTEDERLDRRMLRRFLPRDELARLETAGLDRMLLVCGVLLLVIGVNSLATFAAIYCLQWVGQRVVMDLRVRFFSHLQRLPVSFHNTTRAGDMLARTVADTQLLHHTVSSVMTDMVRQPVVLLMVLAYIVATNWQLALFSMLLIPTCAMPIVLIGQRVRRISREGQRCLGDLTAIMQETLGGVAVIKAFGQEARAERGFAHQCRRFFRRMMSATKAKALNDPIAHMLGGIGGVGVLLYAMIANKPLVDCVVFAGAVWALYEPVKKLGRINMEIQQSSAAAERVFEVLDTPPTVTDRPGVPPLTEPLRELVFDHVRFRYDGEQTREVFTDLNLRIPAGQSLALVGPSGCGKTTLAGLLLRFFDVTGGSVRYNDTDLRDCTVASLRERIGLVMQDTFLFADTIAANIAYGKPDAASAEIEDAARRANAHDFIRALPRGYDTLLGERGAGLSGGQRQRLAIARAILRKPPILILDEATSALDTQAERLVQADIERLMGAYTVIVIAHRLSTIAKCDRIAVLGDGGIREYGTHAELHARGALYRELHDLQFIAPPTTPRLHGGPDA